MSKQRKQITLSNDAIKHLEEMSLVAFGEINISLYIEILTKQDMKKLTITIQGDTNGKDGSTRPE